MNAVRADGRSVESEQKATAAFRTISGMEENLATIRDLGIAVSTMVLGISNLQDGHAAALNRLGMLIVEHLDTAEAARGEAFGQLHGYVHPGREARP